MNFMISNVYPLRGSKGQLIGTARTFKKERGITPGEYRRNHRK